LQVWTKGTSMSVVKSLIGSVVGAAVATGIYYGIQQSTGETYIWFPLVTGALTGIVARVLGGSTSNAASFVCGAFAALIAAIAIFGVDLGPKFMEINYSERGKIAKNELMEDPAKLVTPVSPGKVSTPTDEAGSSDKSEGTDNTEDESGSEDAKVPFDAKKDFADRSRMPDEAKEAEAAAGAAGATAGAAALPKKQDSWVNQYLPYIFNGIGILFAYQIARGFGPATPKTGKDA
jgi:hypothetical protein